MLVRDKSFYSTFFKLSAIIAAQNLLSFGVSLADNIMLGRYSETTLAAAAMVNQIQFLLQMVSVGGIGAGTMVMVSQYWGKGDIEPIRRIIALSMKFTMAIGLLFFLIATTIPEYVVSIFTSDPTVHPEAVTYLRILCFTFLVFPVYATLISSVRGAKIVIIGTIISVVSLFTNITLNYMLIFGNWGAPELGIAGAAYATLISHITALLITLIYLRCIDKKLHLRLLSFFKPDAYYLSDFFKAAIPVVLSGFSWGIGMMLQVVILGHMSKGIVAANSIASTVYSLITAFSFGLVSSSNVIMGNLVGSGEMEKIRPTTRTLQLLYIAVGIVTALVLFVARDLILSIYILEPETYDLARRFISLLVIVVVFASYQYPAASGIVMGGGNTRYPVIVETLFIWLCVLPLSALSAFVWSLPPTITFLFLKSDQFLKCIPNAIVVNRYRWVRILTRDASEDNEKSLDV